MLKESQETAAYLTKDTARKSMQEARSKTIPPCPQEMGEVIKGLEEGKYEAFQDMVLGHVSWNQKKGSETVTQYGLIIGNRELFNDVTKDATFFFCDATFRITPRQARVLSMRGSQVPRFQITIILH